MQITELSPSDQSKDEAVDEHFRFESSLKELRDLRSQLHYAADYCETTFLKSQDKKAVVEDTKEYICKAVVTLVDHLGNVSANLNHCVAKTDEFSKVERHMDCLKQRLQSCQQYSQKTALTRIQWSAYSPKHERRYLTTRSNNDNHSRDGVASDCVKLVEKEDLVTTNARLLWCTRVEIPFPITIKIPLMKNSNEEECDSPSSLVPVRDGLSVSTRAPIPTFHFQTSTQTGTQKNRLKRFYRRAVQNPDIFSLLRRSKPAAT